MADTAETNVTPISADSKLTDEQTVSYTHLTLPTTPYV